MAKIVQQMATIRKSTLNRKESTMEKKNTKKPKTIKQAISQETLAAAMAEQMTVTVSEEPLTFEAPIVVTPLEILPPLPQKPQERPQDSHKVQEKPPLPPLPLTLDELAQAVHECSLHYIPNGTVALRTPERQKATQIDEWEV